LPAEERPGLKFDSVDDVIQVANSSSIDIQRTLTVEVTFTVDSFPNFANPIVWKGSSIDTTGAQRTYSLWAFRPGYLHFTSGDGSVQSTLNTESGLIQEGRTYHFSGVIDRDNGAMAIYLDGVEVATDGVTQNDAASSTESLLIGGSLEPDYSAVYFDGVIEEVRLWNTARSAAEIAANWNQELTGGEAGLAGYWLASNVSGTELTDLSGEENHGLLVGGTELVQVIPRHRRGCWTRR
jgi:hypothetical protein